MNRRIRDISGSKYAEIVSMDARVLEEEEKKIITITQEEYNDLQNDSIFLAALDQCGVDNWTGWDDACEKAEELGYEGA